MRNLKSILFVAWTIIVIMISTSLISCGPSAEELAAREKAKHDSIAEEQKQFALLSEGSTPTPLVAQSGYIRMIASEYRAQIAKIEVFVVGGDTLVVVHGLGGMPIVVTKNKKE